MPAKSKSLYVCSECGFESAKWYGKCPGCGQWNTMNEEVRQIEPAAKAAVRSEQYRERVRPLLLRDIALQDEQRYHTGLSELDRVLGGGIVKGSIVLLGGDPGIGKSTILLQICQYLGQQLRILYVSGEESQRQLKLRAARLHVDSDNLYVMAETDIESIIEQIKADKPDVVMIDSIQTMNLSQLNSSPGSVTQVRECTNALMRTGKSLEIPIFIVGHVNKDGAIAGPKVLEHIVDAVLYFEGDRQMTYRILRAVKNRYGSTNEIGVFQMEGNGLQEVENPSMLLLSGRPKNVSGTCVACSMEGTRPILAEIQGLATASSFGNPRRMATGFDYNRLSLILAVLEKRAGYFFSNVDAYLNVVGGLRLDEPATDLAVAMALVSSLKDVALSEDAVAFGEVGLAGEIRSVPHALARVREAARLGFRTCILPRSNLKSIPEAERQSIQLYGVRDVREAFACLTGDSAHSRV
ncbi:MAG TPA: DNA repair protein RadA [Candidatus Gallacutalibacter stercoravium]|nr:DNA repair protein RadA [Candidatus Gallacutalibacter stercoravium]